MGRSLRSSKSPNFRTKNLKDTSFEKGINTKKIGNEENKISSNSGRVRTLEEIKKLAEED